MKNKFVATIAVILFVSGLGPVTSRAAKKMPKAQVGESADAQSLKQIQAMNDEQRRATEAMDNARTMALWDEDGTTLLPGQAAVTGKATIAKWLDGVTAKMPGWRVLKQEQEFHDIQISGDWASEWATTAQTVQPPDGKPAFTIHGKMLLVLHRGSDGKWKIREEAWVSSQ